MNQSTRFGYDNRDNLIGVTEPIELPGENHYRWSEPDTISWPGGSRRQISYTADLKPTRLLDQDPGENPVLDTRYAYDATGNITQRATQSATYDYSYDALQRLSEAKSDVETEGWSYDPNGNRTSDNLNPGEWRYDDNDRLLESPAITYTYDEAGNTVSKTKGSTTTHYRYNAEGRLRRIEDQAQTLIADYQYDPLGRRIKKTTPAGSQYYHYSDEGLAGEYDATGAPIRQYGYRPEGTWMSEPLYQKTAQGYAYYQTDHLGSPQGLISKTGARVWRASYRAFGELAQESGPWANPLRFPGQYYDQETGLHYNYYRDYDPSTGRYVQGDPVGLAGGLNIYFYVSGNPVRFFDPMGEVEFEPPIDPKNPRLDPRNPPRPLPPGGTPEQPIPPRPQPTPDNPGKGDAAARICKATVLTPCLRACASPICAHPAAKAACFGTCYGAYFVCTLILTR